MAEQKQIPKKLRIAMPDHGLAAWWMLGRVLRFVFQSMRLSLQIDGADDVSQTDKGLRIKLQPGGGSAGGGEDPDDPEPTGPMTCTVCPNDAILKAKATVTCGRASCCGTAIIPPGEEDPITEWAGSVTHTVQGQMWDYTGPELISYSCQRDTIADYHPDGNGTATSTCPSSPDCGEAEIESEGCDDAPQCGDMPGPGFKCWFPISSEDTYAKICNATELANAALGAAVPVTDEEFSTEALEGIAGSSSLLSNVLGQASLKSWEFRRFNGRIPVHIVMEIEIRDTETNDVIEVYEEIVTLDANTNTGVYVLEPGAVDRVATVLSCNIVYGRLPEE